MHRTIEVTLPPAATDAFVAGVRGHEHVVGVTLHRGASVEPAGDVVAVHVLNRGADDVLRAVARARAQGPVSVATAELASLSDPAHQPAIDRDRDEAIWEELETGLRHQGRVTPNYLALMALGGVVAAVGALAEPSVAAIAYVASAVIAPGFEPVAKIALGLVLRRGEVVKAGSVSTLAGYLVLILAAAVTWWGLHAVGAAEAGDFLGGDALKHTLDPSAKVFLVAACGALAGAVMQAAYRHSVIAGALIALRIIESAGVAGVALAMGRFDLAGQSLWRLMLDMAFIVAAGLIVFGIKQLAVHRRAPLH